MTFSIRLLEANIQPLENSFTHSFPIEIYVKILSYLDRSQIFNCLLVDKISFKVVFTNFNTQFKQLFEEDMTFPQMITVLNEAKMGAKILSGTIDSKNFKKFVHNSKLHRDYQTKLENFQNEIQALVRSNRTNLSKLIKRQSEWQKFRDTPPALKPVLETPPMEKYGNQPFSYSRLLKGRFKINATELVRLYQKTLFYTDFKNRAHFHEKPFTLSEALLPKLAIAQILKVKNQTILFNTHLPSKELVEIDLSKAAADHQINSFLISSLPTSNIQKIDLERGIIYWVSEVKNIQSLNAYYYRESRSEILLTFEKSTYTFFKNGIMFRREGELENDYDIFSLCPFQQIHHLRLPSSEKLLKSKKNMYFTLASHPEKTTLLLKNWNDHILIEQYPLNYYEGQPFSFKMSEFEEAATKVYCKKTFTVVKTEYHKTYPRKAFCFFFHTLTAQNFTCKYSIPIYLDWMENFRFSDLGMLFIHKNTNAPHSTTQYWAGHLPFTSLAFFDRTDLKGKKTKSSSLLI